MSQEKPPQENLENQELNPEVLEKVMEKVVDINKLEQNDIAFHSLGYWSKFYSLFGGIVYADRVLSRGLLSRDLSQRVNVEQSTLGYRDEDNTNREKGISTSSSLSEVVAFERYTLTFVIKYDRKNTLDYPSRPDSEIIIKRRIKPKSIIGIWIDGKYADYGLKEIEKMFDTGSDWDYSVNSLERYFHELVRVSATLGVSEVETKKVEEYFEEVHKERHFHTRPRSYEEKKELERKQSVGALKKLKSYIDVMLQSPYFEGIETISDYLIKLGKKYEIPIYKDKSLYWPKQIPEEELKKFVAGREKKE